MFTTDAVVTGKEGMTQQPCQYDRWLAGEEIKNNSFN